MKRTNTGFQKGELALLKKVYSQMIDNVGGKDFEAIYMPKAYIKICSFFLENTKDYSEHLPDINKTIEKIGDYYSRLENNELVEVQSNTLMLAIIDSVLNSIKKPRTIENRKNCASALFESTSGFKNWLDSDYIESDMDVVKEVRRYLIEATRQIAKESSVLDKNPRINFGKDQLKMAVDDLSRQFVAK